MVISGSPDCFVCRRPVKFSGMLRREGIHSFEGASAQVVATRRLGTIIVLEATVPCSACKAVNKFTFDYNIENNVLTQSGT